MVGSPYYIAPEVLIEQYNEKCDIWSCGVIFYILLSGSPPFDGENDKEIIKQVKKGKFDFPKDEWILISSEAKDLIKLMLTYNPKERPSAQQCLNHKFFKRYENNKTIAPIIDPSSNIKKFNNGRKLVQATLQYIVSQLISKEEKNKLYHEFCSWDKNNDGVLSKEEIYNGYKILLGDVKAQEETNFIMENFDTDKNGFLDYNEFLSAALNKKTILTKSNLEATFKAFDKDGSGKISIENIKSIFTDASFIEEKSRFEKIIKDFDVNDDGEISLGEFITLMSKIV